MCRAKIATKSRIIDHAKENVCVTLRRRANAAARRRRRRGKHTTTPEDARDKHQALLSRHYVQITCYVQETL